jgi:hypothetical protein
MTMSEKLNLAALLDRLEKSGLSPSGIFVCPLCRHRVHYPECPFVALRAAREAGFVEVLLSRDHIEAVCEVMDVSDLMARASRALVACEDLAPILAAVPKGD